LQAISIASLAAFISLINHNQKYKLAISLIQNILIRK